MLGWVRNGLNTCSEIAEEMHMSKGAISKMATKLIESRAAQKGRPWLRHPVGGRRRGPRRIDGNEGNEGSLKTAFVSNHGKFSFPAVSISFPAFSSLVSRRFHLVSKTTTMKQASFSRFPA